MRSRSHLLHRLLKVMSVIGTIFGCTSAWSAPQAPTGNLTPQQIAARCLPDIVRLTVRDKNGPPTVAGSGVVVAKDRVVTCWHVVDGARGPLRNIRVYELSKLSSAIHSLS